MTARSKLASLLANQRAGRRGMLPVENVLEILPPKLKDEVLSDADAILAILPELVQVDPEEIINCMDPFFDRSPRGQDIYSAGYAPLKKNNIRSVAKAIATTPGVIKVKE